MTRTGLSLSGVLLSSRAVGGGGGAGGQSLLCPPYQEGDLWYVPVEIRSGTGKSETQNAMIKFYQLEGKTLCFIIGSKEKGVVD